MIVASSLSRKFRHFNVFKIANFIKFLNPIQAFAVSSNMRLVLGPTASSVPFFYIISFYYHCLQVVSQVQISCTRFELITS